MSGNTYEIASLNDFRSIPEDRLHACLIEFVDVIRTTNAIEAVMREGDPDVSANLPGFTWIDNGQRGIRKAVIDGEEVDLDLDQLDRP